MTSGGARKGAGRKPTGKNRKPQAAVVLTPEQKRWLERDAKANGQSVSELVHEALIKWGMPR